MYGIFTYIYGKNQPKKLNTPYMDPMGNNSGDIISLFLDPSNYSRLPTHYLDRFSVYVLTWGSHDVCSFTKQRFYKWMQLELGITSEHHITVNGFPM